MANNTEKQIDELLSLVKIQSDLISGLYTQSAITAARLETLLTMQREILVRLGMDREEVKKKSEQIYATHALAAQQEMQQLLSSALKPHDSEEQSPPDSDEGHHLN